MEKQGQKFHTADTLLPRSGSCFRSVEANFQPGNTSQIWVVSSHRRGISALISQTSFEKPVVASQNLRCFLRQKGAAKKLGLNDHYYFLL